MTVISPVRSALKSSRLSSRFWRYSARPLAKKKVRMSPLKRRLSGSDGKIGQGDSPPQLVIWKPAGADKAAANAAPRR